MLKKEAIEITLIPDLTTDLSGGKPAANLLDLGSDKLQAASAKRHEKDTIMN